MATIVPTKVSAFLPSEYLLDQILTKQIQDRTNCVIPLVEDLGQTKMDKTTCSNELKPKETLWATISPPITNIMLLKLQHFSYLTVEVDVNLRYLCTSFTVSCFFFQEQ